MRRFSALVAVAVAVAVVGAAAGAEEGRWVWGGGGRSGGRNAGGYYPPEVLESRPQAGYRPPAPVEEGSDYIQPTYVVPSRPGYRPGPPPPPPPPPRPPPNGGGGVQGILTGPVPSWEQGREDPTAYKHYDRCKCAHSFNCPSPGIQFGRCGGAGDKVYCCFNPKGSPSSNSGPTRPGLVNPAAYERPGDYDRRPVLVGPGGPTGVLIDPDRPYGRPFIANGGGAHPNQQPTFVERPGPYDGYFGDGVRSNKNAAGIDAQ